MEPQDAQSPIRIDSAHAKPLPIADGKTALTALHEIVQARPDKPPANVGYREVLMHETYLNTSAKIGLATRMAVELVTREKIVPTEYGQLIDIYLQDIAEQQRQAKSPPSVATEQRMSAETLEQEAARLALLTRMQGMGYLHGKFPSRINQARDGDFQTVEGFIQGTQLTKGSDLMQLGRMMSRDDDLPYEVWNYKQTNRQVWTAQPYIQQYKVMFEGKSGPEAGVQYDFFMPASKDYDPVRRPGVYVNLTVAVLADIAAQIDDALHRNPYFPDAYFKALYPGYVGQSTETHIRREPATELFIRDLRTNPNPNQGRVIAYPKPIPY